MPENGLHRVKAGDSLWVIARTYGLEVASLRRWNGIPENVSLLTVGDTLRLRPSDLR